MLTNKYTGLMAGVAVAAVFSIATVAAGEPKSGYQYAAPETQAMQDDDFSNPAMLIADYGGELWSTPDGEVNKSCEDCHGDAEDSMKGVKARYPAYYEPWGKLINVELRVNECQKDNQKAKPWKYESREMQGMASYIGYQSRGMPVAVDIGGKATPFLQEGQGVLLSAPWPDGLGLQPLSRGQLRQHDPRQLADRGADQRLSHLSPEMAGRGHAASPLRGLQQEHPGDAVQAWIG